MTFGTWHDSCAVLVCVEIFRDLLVETGTTITWFNTRFVLLERSDEWNGPPANNNIQAYLKHLEMYDPVLMQYDTLRRFTFSKFHLSFNTDMPLVLLSNE